jgi:hypothetical protein
MKTPDRRRGTPPSAENGPTGLYFGVSCYRRPTIGASSPTTFHTVSEGRFSEVEQKGGWGVSSLPMQTCSAYYYCPGALKAVPPALRIISIPSSALNSGVVLVALRCPRRAATSTAAPALASSGAS